MENFAVKSDSFALYEAFKKDVEKIGYTYNAKFGWGEEDVENSFCGKRMNNANCLYFSDKWNSEAHPLSFAFSNWATSKSFSLETQYGEALAFAKKVWEQENKPKSMGCRLGQILANSNATCSISVISALNGTNPFALYTPHLACPYNPAFYDTTRLDLVFSVPTISQDTINALMGGNAKPKFKVGEWIRDITNGRIKKIISIATFDGKISYEVEPHSYIVEGIVEEYKPRRGEYYVFEYDAYRWICICKENSNPLRLEYVCINNCDELKYDSLIARTHKVRPATPSEIALLDSKLAEKGKRFDKEKCELVDIYKPKFAKGDIVRVMKDGRIGVVRTVSDFEGGLNEINLSSKVSGFGRDDEFVKIGNSL